jgi:hypothetical protein
MDGFIRFNSSPDGHLAKSNSPRCRPRSGSCWRSNASISTKTGSRCASLVLRSYGADPRKILLMTFSRRAAAEMAWRVERIARRVMGDNADVMTDALWPGPSMGSARGSCATMRERSASILLSPFMIARTRPI